jgi:transcriptional regulator NrdR family protein
MTCDLCAWETRVIDSRDTATQVRRRRQCLNPACKARFTPYEVPAELYSTIHYSAATVRKLVDLRAELGSVLDTIQSSLEGTPLRGDSSPSATPPSRSGTPLLTPPGESGAAPPLP